MRMGMGFQTIRTRRVSVTLRVCPLVLAKCISNNYLPMMIWCVLALTKDENSTNLTLRKQNIFNTFSIRNMKHLKQKYNINHAIAHKHC